MNAFEPLNMAIKLTYSAKCETILIKRQISYFGSKVSYTYNL